MGAQTWLQGHVGAFQRNSRARTPVLRTPRLRAFQDAEIVSQTAVISKVSPRVTSLSPPRGRVEIYIAMRYSCFMAKEITTAEYQALAELRYRIRKFVREGDAVARRSEERRGGEERRARIGRGAWRERGVRAEYGVG